jgi:exopolysaccharide production protein ExoY
MIKRGFDILFSSLVLLLGAPLFIILIFLVKSSSRGPAFYASLRMGKKGKLIKCWKYRSMSRDAEKKIAELLSQDPQLKVEWERYAKLKNDPRITPLGKWLRKHSLDELPQFWNVLKGDLSLVGPRPYLVEEVRCTLRDDAEKILSVRPGLTGLWQISGRNELSFEERIALEKSYIDKRSLLFDLSLLWKTIPVFLFSKGAY